MEKINKEELMKKLNLSDDDLEKIVGGVNWECFGNCIMNSDKKTKGDVPLIVKCFQEC